MLILEPYEAKNNEGRIFPLNNELRVILQEQEAITVRLERKLGKRIQWLFHDPDGEPLVYHYENRDYYKPSRYFRRHWKEACEASKLVGCRIHDFRRTGIRRFGEHGIDDAVGMRLSGHKSMRIYHDYKAITQEDLFEASEKLSETGVGHKKDTISGVKKR